MRSERKAAARASRQAERTWTDLGRRTAHSPDLGIVLVLCGKRRHKTANAGKRP